MTRFGVHHFLITRNLLAIRYPDDRRAWVAQKASEQEVYSTTLAYSYSRLSSIQRTLSFVIRSKSCANLPPLSQPITDKNQKLNIMAFLPSSPGSNTLSIHNQFVKFSFWWFQYHSTRSSSYVSTMSSHYRKTMAISLKKMAVAVWEQCNFAFQIWIHCNWVVNISIL